MLDIKKGTVVDCFGIISGIPKCNELLILVDYNRPFKIFPKGRER